MITPYNYIKFNKREDFLSLLPKNSICAELGVYSGRFTIQIINKINPKKLYAIDPYWKAYGEKFWWNDKTTWDCFVKAVKRIQKCDKKNVVSFIIEKDIECLPDFKDNFFDWIYLDSTHEYEDTILELEIIKNKIKSNGSICGHDFRDNPKHKHFGVAKAIDEWLIKNQNYELYLRDNHTQWIIRKG